MAHEKVHRVTLTLRSGYEFTARFDDIPGAAPIELDETPPLGAGHGPNASALLAAAVGNCLAASLLFCLQKARATVNGLEVQVAARVVRNESGRVRIAGMQVTVSPDVPAEDLARLERCSALFEDFCIVTESVRRGIPIDVSLTTPSAH